VRPDDHNGMLAYGILFTVCETYKMILKSNIYLRLKRNSYVIS